VIFHPFINLVGVICPEQEHEVVPLEDVQWLHEFMKNGRSDGTSIAFEDAIYLLRRKQYPFQYDPYPWIAGTTHILYVCCLSFNT
jgi:hypothetical protein